MSVRKGPRIRGMLKRAGVLVAALAAGGVAHAQAPALRPVEAIADPVRPAPAEVAYQHPFFAALEEPPKLVERPNPADLEVRVPFAVAARVLETGKVSELAAVEPPLKAFLGPLPALAAKWRFAVPKKGGRPVATWATVVLDLAVSLEKGVYSAFSLEPLKKDEPLAKPFREVPLDEALAKYPADLDPKDPDAVSVEELDALPAAEKTSWSFDASRQRARLTALVEVSAQGTVSRVLPTGEVEPLLARWLRDNAAKWKLTPGKAGGRAVSSWMTLDATLDYTIDTAKKKGERALKKNVRSVRPE